MLGPHKNVLLGFRVYNINGFTTNICIVRKVDYESEKFIHAPMYTYDKVMWLFELVGVVKCE